MPATLLVGATPFLKGPHHPIFPVSRLFVGFVPRFVPLIVTTVPGAPEFGERVVMVGAAEPDDTTNATALPERIWLPATGVWLMTAPAGTVALTAFVTAPTASVAVTNVDAAVVC